MIWGYVICGIGLTVVLLLVEKIKRWI